MKRVLYLSYDGMTDPLGQSQVLPYLEGLAKEKIHFTLISFEKPERIEQLRELIQERCKQANIHWIPLAYTKKPPVFSTLKDIRKMGKIAMNLHKKNPFDLIHCRSYVTALIGLSFKRKKQVPFLFDMRGFWADERVEGKIWDLSKPVYKFIYNYFKKKEKRYFNEADAVISLTETGKQEILSWKLNQVYPEKITVIPCCVDTALFSKNQVQPSLLEEARAKYKLHDKFIVGYVGSIGTWYLLPEMLIVFKQIKKKHPNAVFLFLTQENPELIFAEAKIQSIDHDDFRAFPVQRADMPTYIQLFDCSLFLIKPSFSKKASSPTKQGELMAMGIPIICNDHVGDSGEILRRYQGGIVLPNVELDTLTSFELDWSNFNAEQSRIGAREFFGLNYGIQTYHAVYSQIWTKR